MSEDKPGINSTSFEVEISKDWFVRQVRDINDWENIWKDLILFGSVTVEDKRNYENNNR